MAKEPEGRIYFVDSTKLSEWVKAAIDKVGGKNKLARALGVSTFTVIRYERGEADRIQEAQITAIAAFDKVSFQEILNNMGLLDPIPENTGKLSLAQLANLTRSYETVFADLQCLRGEVNESRKMFVDLVAETQAMSEHLTFLTKKISSLENARIKKTKVQCATNVAD